jgi:hypothetical protein
LEVTNHDHVVHFTHPPGGIVNLAAADPQKLMLIHNYISSVEHNSFVVSTLTAVATDFSNIPNGFRQICVKPLLHSWSKFTAVIGHVFKTDLLHFRSRQGSIAFETSIVRYNCPKVFHRVDRACAPINGAILPIQDASMCYTVCQVRDMLTS